MAVRERTPIDGQFVRIDLPADIDDDVREAVGRLVTTAEHLAERCAQLQEALDSRIVIEQAKGMLAERYALALDESFALLRRAARSNRMRIHDLAAAVVSSRETPAALLQPQLDVRSSRPALSR